MKNFEIAWLAGLLEGEGCFYNYRSSSGKIDIRIELGMTDFDVVDRVAVLFREVFNRQCSVKIRSKKPPHKTMYKVTICGYAAERVMRAILPFMGKRRSARIMGLLGAWDARVVRAREHRLAPECHPEKKHHASGLCVLCHSRMIYAKNRDRINAVRRQHYKQLAAA